MPDDGMDDLARDLRQGAGEEIRAEAAEDEELSELLRRRRQDMAGVARAAMHHGDTVTASVGGLDLTHPIAAVGSDYLTMADEDGEIDVSLETAILTIRPRSAGGRSASPASATFRARLAEHAESGVDVEVVTVSGLRAAGRIELAATDHIVVTGPGTTYIPIASVAVVFSRRRWRRG